MSSAVPSRRRNAGLPKALVLGGTRFVGPALVNRLLDANYHVTVLNRGSRADELPAGVEAVVCDRKDHPGLKEALAGRTFEAVFDVIAYVPEDARGLLDALDRARLRHFVHVSTASVYKESKRYPVKEDFPRGPDPGDAYGHGKYLTEELLFRAYREGGVPVTVVRPGYIYGPRNSVYREAFYFDRLLAGRPLLVPGDGSLITQFGYVDDLASLMVSVPGNERAVGEAYNFAGEFAVTIDEYLHNVVEAVGDRFGSERAGGNAVSAPPGAGARLVHFEPGDLGLGPSEVRRVFPYRWREHAIRSTEKARVQLGYRESVGLAGGLRRAFAWYIEGGRERYGFRPDYRYEDEILRRLGAAGG